MKTFKKKTNNIFYAMTNIITITIEKDRIKRLIESYQEVYQELDKLEKSKIDKTDKDYFLVLGQKRFITSIIGDLENLILLD